LYTPDLLINDPYNDLVLYVPPSGYIAGVYAYTDFVSNAWYAPAGLNRGLISVLGLRYKYNQAQRDILAPSQINYVRNFPGLGTAVWEALTLQSKESAFSFINVQRLFDIIGVSVSQALLYSEYEPNDEFLKRQVVNLIAQFLEGIKNARGISDYTVVCDASNNTPAVANIGQLNVDIYIQPILPVRVIQVQLIATKQGVTFQELIATGGNF
jgi:phage tail sheath protein FI